VTERFAAVPRVFRRHDGIGRVLASRLASPCNVASLDKIIGGWLCAIGVIVYYAINFLLSIITDHLLTIAALYPSGMRNSA
jgi:hypothetical protein